MSKNVVQSKINPCSSSSDGDDGPKILAIPIKSPNDDKDYRVIQLANGVRAILISYNPCFTHERKIERNRNCLDREIARFNSEVVGVELRDSENETRPSSSNANLNTKKRYKGTSRKRSAKLQPTEDKRCDPNEYMVRC